MQGSAVVEPEVAQGNHDVQGARPASGDGIAIRRSDGGGELSRLVATLEAYAALQGPGGGLGADGGKLVTSSAAAELSMSRGGADAAARSQWAHLRSKTPAAADRDKASANAISQVSLKSARLATSELEALLKTSAERTPVDPASRIVLAAEIGSAARIYLERLDIAFPGDSGWYIGRADDVAAEAAGSISASEFLNARGDLVDALTLPRGYLVVLDGGGVVSVLGPRDEELWKPAAPAGERRSRPRGRAAPNLRPRRRRLDSDSFAEGALWVYMKDAGNWPRRPRSCSAAGPRPKGIGTTRSA